MSNETKKTALPKLRFPEFRDEPGWSEEALAKNLREHRLKSDGKSEVHSVSVHKGVINQVEHLGRSFSAADTSKYNLAKPHDVIYTKSPTGDFPYGVVKQNLTGRNVIVSPLYGVFAPPNKYVGYLIHAYFEHNSRINNYLVSLVQKGAKNTLQISNDRFLSKGIYLPDNEKEQQKIAACLSSLDDLIAAHGARLAALQAHKRGLMQGLFPAEGETVPKRRFPAFQDAGEWEEKTLGELGELVSGLTYSPGDVRENGLLVLRSSNIYNSKIALEDCVYVKPTVKGANLSKPNDILICVRNGSKTLIGKNALIPTGMPLCTHGAFMTVFRSPHPDFVFQLFQTDLYNKQVSADLGATINSINGSQLLKYTFCVPKPEERQKIAACLSALDDRLTAQTDQLVALKRHKQGLMQVLFPSSNLSN